MFLTMMLYYYDLLFGLIHRPYVLQPQRFKGWFFPRHQVKPLIEASSIDRTQQ
jgi:hypothetical protein